MLSHKKSGFTALFCLALATAGCAGDPDRDPGAQKVADAINSVFYNGKWQQVPATPENQAETIIFEQRVSFDDSAAVLDRRARRAIVRLLEEAAPNPNSLISLSVAGSGSAPATYDRLTLQRLEAVRLALSDLGYQSTLANTAEARVGALADDEVGLTVTKVMAILPDCNQPQPLEPDRPDFTRGFGCANAYNLGVMVADPADLERGRTLEPADAERHSESILRYRVGKEDELQEEDTGS
ncbi:CpaD family pilus assembly lipoprotein [Pelagibius sp. CAU 1746]|uniref:CpaD family pilus assembly lipoprotein n=1 Tax=Pelagibius sp. CAU 1746 TaxID=3140370 RepID=UPI00325B7E55